jgi:integrase
VLISIGQSGADPYRIPTRVRSPHGDHDLRHWSATEAIGRGNDIRTVAGRLGHANPAMTLRTYAHALDGADAGLAATLAIAVEEHADDDR